MADPDARGKSLRDAFPKSGPILMAAGTSAGSRYGTISQNRDYSSGRRHVRGGRRDSLYQNRDYSSGRRLRPREVAVLFLLLTEKSFTV